MATLKTLKKQMPSPLWQTLDGIFTVKHLFYLIATIIPPRFDRCYSLDLLFGALLSNEEYDAPFVAMKEMPRMPPCHILKYLASFAFILSCFVACNSSVQGTASTDPLPGIPTVTIDNTAPSNLDMDFVVVIDQPAPGVSKSLRISPYLTYQHQLVNFVHGEKITCGSTVIKNGTGLQTAQIPVAGTTMQCSYSSPQGSASFAYTVPPQLTISAPASGTTVTRSTHTQVTFSLLPNCQSVGVIVGNENPDGSWDGASVDGGGCVATQTTDTTNEPAGPGMVGAVEVLNTSSVTNNPGFHSFLLNVRTTVVIPVTWK